MSIIGKIPQSDELYLVNALDAVTRLQEWLEGKADEVWLNPLYRLLEEMKCRTEFRPSFCSNEPEPLVVGGLLEYREAVWKLVASELEGVCPHHFENSEEKKAEWLQGVVHKAIFFEKVSKISADLKRNLQQAVNEFLPPGDRPSPSWLEEAADLGNFGQEEKAILSGIAPGLYRKLSVRIESGGAH